MKTFKVSHDFDEASRVARTNQIRAAARFILHCILLAASSCVLCLPAEAQNRLTSTFARKAPHVDGSVGWGEWDGAARLNFEHGFVALRNDNERLYVLVDVLGAREPDPRDYFWLSFDVDRDGAISPNRDLNFTFDGETRNLGYQYYVGPGRWTGLSPSGCSSKAELFDSFLADASTRVDLPKFVATSPHRVWELAIDLAEIDARPGGKVRFGLRVASPAMQFVDEMPAGFSEDFSKLVEVDLSRFGPLLDGGAEPKAVVGLEADPIEVTQAIQTRQNTLPLVQDKSTVARVYVSVTGTTEAQPVTVCLTGRRGGVNLPGSPLIKKKTVPRTVNRARLDDTPAFALPQSWTEGTVTLQAKVRHFYSGDTFSAPITVTFTPKQIPTYWIVPLNYGTVSTPNVPSSAEIALQQSYLRTVYPLRDVNFVVKPWSAIGTVSASDPMSILNNYYDQVALGWVLGLIFTGTPPFDLPKQVYGFRPSGGGLSDPVWCGGRGYVAWGFRGSSLEGTMAHEMNHNLDRNASATWGHHTPFGCGAVGPDPSWPYPNSNIQEVGVDVRPPLDNDNAVALNFPDFMGYCQSGASPTKWISPYRWNNLFNSFPDGAAALPAADNQAQAQALLARVETVYYISGSLTPNGAGRLNPVLVQPGMPTETIARGEYAIELLDANGNVLRSIPFMVSFVDVEGNKVDVFSFNYQIAAQEGVAEIVLRRGGELLDSIKVSRSAPQIVVREPNGGEVWNGLAKIAWAATDEDGDALNFDILYTPNDGASWLPVARGVRGEGYEVDSNLLPGGTKARIRVIATDGFNTSEDDSDRTFTVVGKPPNPNVLQPQPDALLVAGEPITFETDAADLEDGVLPDLSCFWTYRGMIFGIGRKVEACLPEGNHEVMLTLTDSDGNVREQMFPTRVSMGGPSLYLNCGGTADLTDAVGRVWKPADPFLAFGHPAVNTLAASGIVNTMALSDPSVPNEVLLSEHWRDGSIAYQVPVANGDYRVVLYFSENYPPAVGPRFGGTGCADCARLFNVMVEGQQVSEFNPADAALPPAGDGKGAVFTATELKFDVAVKDGVLDIQLADLGAGNPPENPSIKAICVFNTRLGRLDVSRNPDGTMKLFWPISIGGSLQIAREVRGPYENFDAPVRLEGENAAVDLPANAPRGFYRLMLAP